MLAGAAAALAASRRGPDTASLRGLAAARGLVFGSAAATYELKDSDFVAALARDAAQLVPEYEMKRDVLEPEPGRYDFADLDRLFAFAARPRAFDARPSPGLVLRQSALAGADAGASAAMKSF